MIGDLLGLPIGDGFGGGQGFGGGGNVQITQINYGVEGAQDSLTALEELLNNLLEGELPEGE